MQNTALSKGRDMAPEGWLLGGQLIGSGQ
ncbi:hypothetical protein RHCRD62_90109 [Rhodococcus sp. RD6.2]|nr:hypothetical protein RHCRD62_90109 [Rhodococcus sp. RD6.2]